MPTETTTLYNDENQGQAVVLSGTYRPDWSGFVEQTILSIWGGAAHLVRLNNEKKPKKFAFTEEEADNFTVAWTAFRVQQKAKEEAEKQRLSDVIAQAKKIAESCSAIQVKEHKAGDDAIDSTWSVSVPDINYYYNNRAYTPDSFLGQVKDARTAWQSHQDFVDAQKSLTAPLQG